MKPFLFPQEIYNQSLQKVEDVQFSPREIEVIANILLEEDTKQIPHHMPITEEVNNGKILYTYEISDSTVESYIENIYEKLSSLVERNKEALKNIPKKRDRIKLLIAKSDKKLAFENYCQALKIENLFLEHLEKVFHKYAILLNGRETITCQIHYWNPPSIGFIPIAYSYLARHLNDRKPKNIQKIITTTLRGGMWEQEEGAASHALYILSSESAPSLS